MTRAALPLSEATLGHHAQRVAVPGYDRARLAPGVLHISVGSFHRAHQAVYLDDLAALGHREWGLVGVGLHRPQMREALEPQDGLFTVVERGAGGDHARVVRVVTRYLFAPQQRAELLHALRDPRLRLVTLTITGAGYTAHPSAEGSAIDLLVAGLARRRADGLPPFTVLSCDNLPGNGDLARGAVVGLAAARDPELARWIDAQGAFPSSMVDRITPRTSDADRAWVAEAFGVRDRWPVITEPFSQWVVEDRFSAGRPPLEEVGVQLVDDVAPYALLKTRMLNASHCVLGHLGGLLGHGRTDEAVGDPLLRAALDALMEREVQPLLHPVPGVDVDAYRATVLERLANPVLGDRLARLRRNGSDKVPVHVVSSLARARASGRPHGLLALGVAAWLRCLRGTDEAGRPLELEDPRAARLGELARRGGPDPRPLLHERGLFGALAGDEALAAQLAATLEAFERDGVRTTVRAALAAQDTPAVA
ncbi:mannitol dehydrogenase family protein [Conexibacter sp. SYSU D00693]|uniref:mannitol dehydrogenase family protein n=1 Tax=Conexibacter sp. SYSU D00693 TaxID=2812560 RepID=UPI00196ACC04|nr:mannitol dehydrogenase family protein [Conexibacter sp. SYSU D00693]